MDQFLKIDISYKSNGFKLEVKDDLPKGIVGIYGPSGSGKTTLLRSIAGLLKPDEGYIVMDGNTIYDHNKKINLPIKNRNIGYVFQEDRLFPHLSVAKNLSYAYNAKGGIKLKDVIEILKIEHLLDKYPEECSGGERQRIAIGRVLLSSPSLLLMDEPFSAVDNMLRKDIIPYLVTINKKYQIPIIIVSHDVSDLLSLTNYLILLYEGKVLGSGLFRDLINDEKNVTLFQGTGLYNGFSLSVSGNFQSKNIVLLQGISNEFTIQALVSSIPRGIESGMNVRVLLRPEDISLSLSPVSGISLRNQIEGTIEKIIEKDGFSLCLVDVGEKMLVEITEASRYSLGLKQGLKVYCLFKSVSLKIF